MRQHLASIGWMFAYWGSWRPSCCPVTKPTGRYNRIEPDAAAKTNRWDRTTRCLRIQSFRRRLRNSANCAGVSSDLLRSIRSAIGIGAALVDGKEMMRPQLSAGLRRLWVWGVSVLVFAVMAPCLQPRGMYQTSE